MHYGIPRRHYPNEPMLRSPVARQMADVYAGYREVLNRFQSTHDYVWKIHCAMFVRSHSAILAMNLSSSESPIEQRFLQMYLLSERGIRLSFTPDQQQHFLAISSVFVDVCDTDEESYWLSRNFFNVLKKHYELVPNLVECVDSVLKREDAQLMEHLESIGTMKQLPLSTWFYRCFAGILPVSSLVRVWDRVIGGSMRILPYVAVALLVGLRRQLHAASDTAHVLQAINNMSEDTADVITNKAIEAWQKYGGQTGAGLFETMRRDCEFIFQTNYFIISQSHVHHEYDGIKSNRRQ